jgi:ESS family glutamate:Na+ symporter
MIEVSLDMYQSAAVAAIVLGIGIFLVRKIPVLRKFCIPTAVIGGLLFSVAMLITHSADLMEVTMDETIREICMRIFFCSIGFLASFAMLRAGGKMVIIMVVLTFVLICIQNFVGIMSVGLFDLDPKYGLALGSMSLIGGHGTSAAFGEILVKDYGLEGGDVVAIAAATFGLAIAGIIGGPLSRHLVRKNNLTSSGEELKISEINTSIDQHRFLQAVLIIVICLGGGVIINELFSDVGISLPSYLGAMILAFILRNLAEYAKIDIPMKELETVGWVALCLFLAMALMGMKLWQLADLAAPMVFTLVIQTIILILFVYFVVFRATGKNYESAAMVAGMSGFGMGATPNAVANMEALMGEFGPAPVAYFVVPIVGGVFLDFLNVAVLTTLLNVL